MTPAGDNPPGLDMKARIVGIRFVGKPITRRGTNQMRWYPIGFIVTVAICYITTFGL